MELKGYRYMALSIGMITMMLLSMFIIISDTVEAAPPEFSSVSFDTVDDDVSQPVNISVTFIVTGETINNIDVQSCVGDECKMPETMMDSGDGETFYYEFPVGYFGTESVEPYFHFFVDYGAGSSFIYPADLGSHEINTSLIRLPKFLLINGTADVESIFPGQTVTITGDLSNDMEEPVEGADIQLSINGTTITNSTTSGTGGSFEIGAVIDQEGEFVINISSIHEALSGFAEYPVSVSSWPRPLITIEGDVDASINDIPPASDPDTYYLDSNITLTYWVRNTGTGTAGNVTVELSSLDGSFSREIEAGNISISERYEYQLFIPANLTGPQTFMVSAQWDQVAPFPENFTFPNWTYSYSIIPRPEWTGHTVLVEMFTQTTCAPCVDVEESIERLYRESDDISFEFMIYVIDDEESALVSQEMGITGTPDLFIDKDLFRYTGSKGLTNDSEMIRSYVENASEVETAPVSMNFLNMSSDPTLTLSLPIEYMESFSGMLTVYRVESFSNLRNHQGIPVTNRYRGVHSGHEIDDLLPGSTMNFTLEAPDPGIGLIAVITSDLGDVANSASYHYLAEPEVFLKSSGTPLLKLTTPAEGMFNLTLESFHMGDDHASTHDVGIWTEGLPEGWSLSVSGVDVVSLPVNVTFDHSAANMETLPVGRSRYSLELISSVSVPENISGTFNFKVHVISGDHSYSMSVVVIAYLPDGNDDWPPNMEISEFYMEGEGKNVFLYVEASGVPDNATVKARILPCDYGTDVCGLPKEVVLAEQEDGRFRATINSNVVDLSTFTHLTYSAWIEVGGMTLETSGENKTVEISTLIDKEVILDDDDDTNGEGVDPLLIALSVGGVIFLIALLAVIFIISRRGSGEDEPVFDDDGLDDDGSGDLSSGPIEPAEEKVETQEEPVPADGSQAVVTPPEEEPVPGQEEVQVQQEPPKVGEDETSLDSVPQEPVMPPATENVQPPEPPQPPSMEEMSPEKTSPVPEQSSQVDTVQAQPEQPQQ